MYPMTKNRAQNAHGLQVPERLLDRDHSATTVLMHAAGAGRSAVFSAVLNELLRSFPNNVSSTYMLHWWGETKRDESKRNETKRDVTKRNNAARKQ